MNITGCGICDHHYVAEPELKAWSDILIMDY